ncbi:MAG: N-acetylmuramoyl-L-alanine amidase [Candidatus Omnitrophica bacterium]|nr:N-acetylmuramoyl-L-alanine amidase [Candidatus Omnitrophota bacterium]
MKTIVKVLFGLIFLTLISSGCATLSTTTGLTTYFLDGQRYVSLVDLCKHYNLQWSYDILTRTVELRRQAQSIRLQVNSNSVFVNGTLQSLNRPVQLYDGSIVVPEQFRIQIIEPLVGISKAKPKAIGFYSIRKVIIDPGHGGKDPGAISKSGLYEKEVVLDIGKRIANLLRRSGVEVLMTRTTDKFVPLEERARLTEKSKADLFVSIHANANRERSLNGFEIYYLVPKISDMERAQNAARTFSLDDYKDSLASSDTTLKAILWDLIYSYNKKESIRLARHICSAIDQSLDCRVIGSKGANFCVLRRSTIPAVLIEVGFMSNLKEAHLLSASSYRQQIAEAIHKGLRDYDRTISCIPEQQLSDEFYALKSKERRK